MRSKPTFYDFNHGSQISVEWINFNQWFIMDKSKVNFRTLLAWRKDTTKFFSLQNFTNCLQLLTCNTSISLVWDSPDDFKKLYKNLGAFGFCGFNCQYLRYVASAFSGWFKYWYNYMPKGKQRNIYFLYKISTLR